MEKNEQKKKQQQQRQKKKTKKQANQRNRTKQKPNGKNKKLSYDKINQTQSHVRIYTYKHLTKRIAITEIKYLIAFHKYIFKCR